MLAAAHQAVDSFAAAFADTWPRCRRNRSSSALPNITRKDNVAFDGLARVAHVTDATDWRVNTPSSCLYPDTEDEIAHMVKACIELRLTIIPRGAALATLAAPRAAVAQLGGDQHRKLDRHQAVEYIVLPGLEGKHATIQCGGAWSPSAYLKPPARRAWCSPSIRPRRKPPASAAMWR